MQELELAHYSVINARAGCGKQAEYSSFRCYYCAVITIAIRLRYDYDVSRACFHFDAIRREQKMNVNFSS